MSGLSALDMLRRKAMEADKASDEALVEEVLDEMLRLRKALSTIADMRPCITDPYGPGAMWNTRRAALDALAGLKRQYYFRTSEDCTVKSVDDSDCVCWHDEGTGPLKDSPEKVRLWRKALTRPPVSEKL